MSGTSAWLAAHTRSWGGKAAADVLLATALEESLPVTREALAVGAVSTAHAAVIAHTTSRLPESLTEEERAKVESALVAQAKHVDPARLRRAARRALLAAERTAAEADAHEDAELRGEEARAEARVRLTMHDNRDGTVTGHFTVPTLAGSDPAQDDPADGFPSTRRTGRSRGPRRGSRGAGAGRWPRQGCRARGVRWGGRLGGQQVGRRRDARRCSGRRLGARHGQAFVELLEHLDTDRLNGKVAATVVVTIDHERLRENLGAAHLDTGHDLSASEARRLACSAGLLPAVLDGTSLPLDLGRSNRFFSEAQRVALATTYDECAAEGCDRPYAWCELHHEDPWAAGGATDLHLAVPLCGFHHQRVHDPATSTVSAPTATAARALSSIGGRRRWLLQGWGSRRWPGAGRNVGSLVAANVGRGRRRAAAGSRRGRPSGQPSALPRRTRRWPRRTSPATTAGWVSTAGGAGVRGRPASRTASARASRSSGVGSGSG